MATQNPIEQEGVYALPEAQLDRFMMKLVVKHNSEEEELEIMRKGAAKSFKEVEKVLSIEELHALQSELDKIHIDKELEHYIIQLISATRNPAKFGLERIGQNIMFGVSPRASIDLYKAAKAKAFLRDNTFVTPADIGYVIHDVFRHRIVLSYEARAKGVGTDEIISAIVETLPIP
jgi:MoxR-like ATPase